MELINKYQIQKSDMKLLIIELAKESWNANLEEAILHGANLAGANLWTANLKDANLYGANLQEADLFEANLWGAKLWQANLQEAEIGDKIK